MKDFMEIMNFCGYDLEKADAMAKECPDDVVDEVLREAGLESLKGVQHGAE